MDDLKDVKAGDLVYEASRLWLALVRVTKVERRGKGITILTGKGGRWDVYGKPRGSDGGIGLRLRKRTPDLDVKFREQQQHAALKWVYRSWDSLSPEQRIRIGDIAAEIYRDRNGKEEP